MAKRKAGEEEEELFPRGRPAVDPNAERHVEAPKETRYDKLRRRKKARVAEEAAEERREAQELSKQELRAAYRFRPGGPPEGTVLIAAVREANADEICLNLPYSMVGFVSRVQAMEPEHGAEGQLPPLPDIFTPGRLVVAVVLGVASLQEPGSSFRSFRVELSLRPSLINAGLTVDSVCKHMWLAGTVQSEEEHVFRLGFGVEGLQGTLPKSEAAANGLQLVPGAVLQVAVQSVNAATGSLRCTTTARESLGKEELKMEALKAGFLVQARIDKVFAAAPEKSSCPPGANVGVVAAFCGALTGTIHWHHQGATASASSSSRAAAAAAADADADDGADDGVGEGGGRGPGGGGAGPKLKQRVTARVLAVAPGSDGKVEVHLTLLPHLLDWAPQSEALAAIDIGARLESEALDFIPKFGARLRLRQKGASWPKATPALAFCTVPRLADEGVGQDGAKLSAGSKAPCRVMGYNFLEAMFTVTRRSTDMAEDVLISVRELKLGQIVRGEIARIVDYGVHVKLSEYVSGLVHLRQLTDVPLATVPRKYQVGTKLKCRVMRVHMERRQVTLTAKKTLVRTDFHLTDNMQARKGMLLTGYVTKVEKYGALVSFFGNAYGLIPAREMERDEAPPAPGMAVECRVSGFDRRRKRLLLSLDLEGGQPPAECDGPTLEEDVAAASAARDQRMGKQRLPKISKPEEELSVGTMVRMKVANRKGPMVYLHAPIYLHGHLHLTHCVDRAPVGTITDESSLTVPQQGDVVEARVLSLKRKRPQKSKETLWDVELTCRPSLLTSLNPAADCGSARVGWGALEVGQTVVAAVQEVLRDYLWVEVAPEIRARIAALDATTEVAVARALGDTFRPGQVLHAQVLSKVSSLKSLDLHLHKEVADGLPVGKTLAKLMTIEPVKSFGVAATFRLPGRRYGFAHITELFDFWAQFPLNQLKRGHIYEAYVLRTSVEVQGGKAELSLRASKVYGRQEGPEEQRAAAAGNVKVGQKVSGYVVASNEKGIFIAISNTLTARMKLGAVSEGFVSKENVAQLYPPGSLIRQATVVYVDTESGKVGLSLNKTDHSKRLTIEQLATGDVVSGRVKTAHKYGFFMRIDHSTVDGFVHVSDVSDNASASLESYKPGSVVSRAKVLKVEDGKVRLGLKLSLFSAEELEEDEVDEDEDLEVEEEGAADEEEAADEDAEAAAEAEDEPNAAPGEGGEDAEPAEAAEKDPGAAQAAPKKAEKAKAAKRPVAAADSDDEAPWDDLEAFSSKLEDPKDGVEAFSFPEFTAQASKSAQDQKGDGSGDEAAMELKRPNKRQRREQKLAEARQLQLEEAEQAERRWATDPRSVEDFEKLLLTQGDTSIVWIRYMAFHLKMSDMERARQVAERAVKHVGFTEGKERFNVWVAFMNLECTYGTEESADAVVKRAASHNDAKPIYLQLARIHERNQKLQLAVKVYETCCKKFPQSKKVWLAFLSCLYQHNDVESGRKQLPKALAALPRRKHPLVVSKAALLEYEHGVPERGRSVFEGLLDSYPKRTDLWSVYLDAHVKANTPPKAVKVDHAEVRHLMERCCTMRLKAAKMRFFFKKWLDFEKRWGDVESQELVRSKARDFVEKQAT